MISILGLQYPLGRKFIFRGRWAEEVEAWNALEPSERKKIGVVAGHCNYRTGISEIDEAPAFILLRDPMKRAVSFCRHALNPKKNHYLWEAGIRTLDELLNSPPDELINQQTKILANDPSYCDDGSTIRRLGENAALELAKTTLTRDLKAFGIQERFDLSMIHIARSFGWRPPVYLRRNESDMGLKVDFSQAQSRKLEELNALDIELYDFARRRFHEIVEQANWREAESRRFARWQAAASPILKLHRCIRHR